jgi:Calcineurin-like phosphoesterase/CARDB
MKRKSIASQHFQRKGSGDWPGTRRGEQGDRGWVRLDCHLTRGHWRRDKSLDWRSPLTLAADAHAARLLVVATLGLVLLACNRGSEELEPPTVLVPTRASLAGAVPAGLPPRLLVGLKEDRASENWMLNSGVPWDMRYRYFNNGTNSSGFRYGWFNNYGNEGGFGQAPKGTWARAWIADADADGPYIPVITYYNLVGEAPVGENTILQKVQTPSVMNNYFTDFKFMMTIAKEFNKPILVLVEADGFGFLQKQANHNPNVYAAVRASGVPELSVLGNTVKDFGLAFLRLRQAVGADKVILGIHVSHWVGADIARGYGDIATEVQKTYDFLRHFGLSTNNVLGLQWDLLVGDPSDRDADYYRIVKGDQEHWWDPSDSAPIASRSFNRYAEWLRQWNVKSGKRWVLWQIPIGNSAHPNNNNSSLQDGSSPPHLGWKDNRPEYFFSTFVAGGANSNARLRKFADAGVIALLFGQGDPADGGSTNKNDYFPAGSSTLFMKSRAGRFLSNTAYRVDLAGGTGTPSRPAYSSSLTVNPGTLTPGQTTSITATVSNTNAAALSPAEIRISIDDEGGQNLYTKSCALSSLAAGGSATCQFNWTGPTTAGTYYVRIAVWSGPERYHWDPGAGLVTVQTAMNFSSVAIAQPARALPQSTVSITGRVNNLGATLSNAIIDIRVYDSTNARVGLGRCTGQNIAAGASADCIYNWTASPTTGSYRVGVMVLAADGSTIHHSNPNAGTIEIAAAEMAFRSSVALSATRSTPGTAVTIDATVTNTGTETLYDGIIDVQVYDANHTRVGRRSCSGRTLAPGASSTCSYTWTPDAAGVYTVTVGVFDPNWDPNYYWDNDAATINVTTSVSGPEFTSAINVSPRVVGPGGLVSITATVTNMGGTTLSGGIIDVEVYNSDQRKVGQLYCDDLSIAPGASARCVFDWSASATTGRYDIDVGVFGAGWTPLYHWNDAGASVSVEAPAYGFTSSAHLTTSSVSPGSSVTITATVNNTSASNFGNGVIDIEVFNETGHQVGQGYCTGVSISAAGSATCAYTWTAPSLSGPYRVDIGVFGSGWDPSYHWNSAATSITVLSTPSVAFTSSARASPATVVTGGSVVLDASVTNTGTATITDAIIDIEVKNAAGTKVGQGYCENVLIVPGASSNCSYNWTAPSITGSYRVTVGVFGAGWAPLHHWNDQASAISVVADSSQPPAARLTFAVIGDYGANSSNESDVARLVSSWSPDVVLTTGDNCYKNERTPGYAESVEPYYGSFYAGKTLAQSKFFPVLGNHDVDDLGVAAFTSYFNLYGNERYYDFVRGNVHFIALNNNAPSATYDGEADGYTPGSRQEQWMRGVLGSSQARWKVVYLHKPPYSTGSIHGSHRFAQWDFTGADVVIAGDDHIYERIDKGGRPYYVNGAGGSWLYDCLPDDPPHVTAEEVVYCMGNTSTNARFGAMRFTAYDTNMDVAFIDRYGGIHDPHTLHPRNERPAIFHQGTNDYTGTRDTYLRQASATTAYGSAPEVLVDGEDGAVGADINGLVRWDLSAIPRGSVVTSATIDAFVINPSSQPYEVQELTRDWSEADATWTQASATVRWAGPGATGLGDRAPAVLSTFTPNGQGFFRIPLNAWGVAVVQRWVDNPTTNFGLILSGASNVDGVDFASSENATVANRPRLVVGYTPPASP